MGLTGSSTTIPARKGSGRSGQVLTIPDPGILLADTRREGFIKRSVSHPPVWGMNPHRPQSLTQHNEDNQMKDP